MGLGNPEEKYLNSRHNVGFVLADELRKKFNLGEWEYQKKFQVEQVSWPEQDTLIIRPQNSMNLSGQAVVSVANFFKIEPQDVLVVHDDVDIILGQIKIKFGGGMGGHHGVESVAKSLGTEGFGRLRLGIGSTSSHSEDGKRMSFAAEKFVLADFSESEHHVLKQLLKKALESVKIILDKGLTEAQNQYH